MRFWWVMMVMIMMVVVEEGWVIDGGERLGEGENLVCWWKKG